MIAVGFGMSAFGLAYFTVHDGFIHGRLPVGFLSRFAYFRCPVEVPVEVPGTLSRAPCPGQMIAASA